MPLTSLERQLSDEIARRHDELISELARWVAIPTGWNHAPGLDALRSILARRLEAIGGTIELVPGATPPTWLGSRRPMDQADAPPTLVARRKGTGPTILLVGHIDTVHDPDGPFQELTCAPDGQTAEGPGAVDMKGGLMVMIAAMEALHTCGVDVAWTVVINSDEETGSFCSDPCFKEVVPGHDFGFVVEPGLPGDAIAIERMGSGQFMIEVRGRSAHAGRDFTSGVSAVEGLARCILEACAMAEPDRGITVNIGPLTGGGATNVVPDHAACWGNVRFPDEESAEALGVRLDALATSGEGLPRVTVHRAWNRPAKPRTPAVDEMAAVVQAVAGDLDQTITLASTGGVCDGNMLQQLGVPVLDSLGIRGGNLHRSDEWIEVKSLCERAALLAVSILRLTRSSSEA